MKIVSRDKVPEQFRDIVRLYPHAVLVERATGEIGFQEDPLIVWLIDSGQIDLNRLCIDFEEGKFSAEAYMDFYRRSGWDLYHFCAHFENGTEKRMRALEDALRNLKTN